jgi:hypothetical protein
MSFIKEINRRRTFGIISHPDAGKTTLTEKLLLFGGAIQEAGAVKSNNFSVSVVLPASGCEMIPKVRLRSISFKKLINLCANGLQR